MNKKLLASLLALCMVLAIGLTACSSGDTATTTTAAADTTTTAAAGDDATTAADGETTAAAADDGAPATWENLSWEKNTSPVTLSLYIDFDWYSVDTWGEDQVSQEITRLTGVSLDVIKSSDLNQLSVMLAAQELNDITFTSNLPQRFEDPDICAAWDELSAQYCPEFMENIDPLEKLNNTAPDGHIYTLKTHYNNDANWADPRNLPSPGDPGLYYRADIMEKLSLPMFNSVETFDETLYAVQAKANEVGITMVFNPHPTWASAIAEFMGAPLTRYWDAESKSIKLQYNSEKWLEYFKLMNKWYRDGIMPKDYLGVRPEDFFQRNRSGQVFAAQYNCGLQVETNELWRQNGTGGLSTDMTKPYFKIVKEPLTYKGEDLLTYPDYNIGWASTFLSASCENLDRAICFMEFLKSPQGDELTQWGIEGKHYTLNEDGLIVRTEEYNNYTADELKQTGIGPWDLQASGLGEGVSVHSTILSTDPEKAIDAQDEVDLLKMRKTHYDRQPVMYFAMTDLDSDELAIQTKLADEWSKRSAQMIAASSEAEVEQLWNDTQAYLKANGIEKVEAMMTANYKEALARYQAAGYFTDIVVD